MYHINTGRATSSFKDSDFEIGTGLQKTCLCSTATLDKFASLIPPHPPNHTACDSYKGDLSFSLSLFFFLHHMVCGISVPQPGIKPGPMAVKA